jgi:hypothetical protein
MVLVSLLPCAVFDWLHYSSLWLVPTFFPIDGLLQNGISSRYQRMLELTREMNSATNQRQHMVTMKPTPYEPDARTTNNKITSE